jgi:hypothetical protein
VRKYEMRLVSPAHRQAALRALQAAPDGALVSIGDEPRSHEQNRKLWAMLTDCSQQILWDDQHLTPEEWKDLFTAAFKNAKIVSGLYGGGVAVGASTSKMSKKKFSEFVEFIYSEGTERGVMWSEPSLDTYASYREAQ